MNKPALFICLVISCLACEEDASEPEIWLDISPVYVGIRSLDAGPYHFDLQFTNRGQSVLEISGYEVRGDRNCAFSFEGPDISEVGKDESAFIRGWYEPVVAAEDQIALMLNSNCHINPRLIVPICGRGVLPGTLDAGPPPACNVPPSDQPDCPR